MNIKDIAYLTPTEIRDELDRDRKAIETKLVEVKAIRAMMENTPKYGDLVGAEIIYVRDILEYILSLEVKS